MLSQETATKVELPIERMHHPGVNFPPPTLFVMAGLGGACIESVLPLPLSSLIALPAQAVLGWTALLAGIAVLVWALATFVFAQTAIYPNRPAAELIYRGPYRFSRNPMYVALSAILFGVGLLADNVWILMLLPVALYVLAIFVIQREEAYLANAFGQQYETYRNRVPRWL